MELSWKVDNNLSAGDLEEIFSIPKIYPSLSDLDIPTRAVSQSVLLSPQGTSPQKQLPIESIPELCKTKKGSKEVQQMISKSNPEYVERVIAVLTRSIGELMTNLYGNYACQTIFSNCSALQRLRILEALESDFVQISKHTRGTHSIQRLISMASLPEEEKAYERAVKGNVFEMSKDEHASHVIQKILSILKRKQQIADEIAPRTVELAMHKKGVCVVKKCVKEAKVFEQICQHCLVLMQDPYGNYAIQAAIDEWGIDNFPILQTIRGKVKQLSVQKFASNVIEKCARQPSVNSEIVCELIKEGISELVDSPFGFYVIKTAAYNCPWEYKQKLSETISSTLASCTHIKLRNRWDEVLLHIEGKL